MRLSRLLLAFLSAILMTGCRSFNPTLKYSIVQAGFIITCNDYDVNPAKISDCYIQGTDVKIRSILNATNIVVEEVAEK